MTTTEADNLPATARKQSISNVVGRSVSTSGDSEIVAAATTTIPPWLTDNSSEPAQSGRGRPTALYPTLRNQPSTTLCESHHDSVNLPLNPIIFIGSWHISLSTWVDVQSEARLNASFAHAPITFLPVFFISSSAAGTYVQNRGWFN